MKKMTLTEFREEGFLQEINRLVLHPCGVALAVDSREEGADFLVLDYREDPEGMLFERSLVTSSKSEAKAQKVKRLREAKAKARFDTGECTPEGVQQIDVDNSN